MSLLADKAIIVTGGASGIGRATCVILAQAGATVLVADWDEKGASETARSINDAGGTAKYLKVNVADEASVAAMVDFAVASFGRLNGAFNNAGIGMHNKSVDDLSLSEWNRVIGVNLTGVFLCMKHEIAAMQKTGGGAIVNTASGAAITGIPFAIDYVATKHAVLGATRAASCEAGLNKVRVNAVMPGLIRTPMTDDLIKSEVFRPHYDAALARHSVGRFGEPEDVGYAVKWLLSDEAAFVNGAGIAVDGGFTAR
jgi:NAD(P)-dependent dehydrogenase (short-subunit alcohol dehydrogenase family)